MRQLFPTLHPDVDPVAAYAGDDRPPPNGRPWVLLNMISSVDGGVSIDGVSGGLGGPADKRVFGAIRAVADVILVASGTVIAEDYRRPQTSERLQAMRQARGQAAHPRIAIVTNSLAIDPAHRVFDAEFAPLVITHTAADRDRWDALAAGADVVAAGDDRVDLRLALRNLRAAGAEVVLAEGGPTLNGALASADLIDEVCLSVSPVLVGGEGPRILRGADMGRPRDLRLDRILEEDGLTFHRYVRT